LNRIRLKDGAFLSYRVHGEGLPLLMIHAPCIGAVNFSRQEPLAESYRLILPDLRGHGSSSPAVRPFAISDIATDLRELLDALEISQAVICGYSQGGSIALECLLQFPERFTGAILVSSFSEVNDAYLHSRFFLAQAFAALHGVKWLARSTAMSHLTNPAEQKRWIAHAEQTDSYTLLQLYLAGHRYTCTQRLPRIHQPVLLVYGEEDKTMHAYGKLLVEHLPQAAIRYIPGVKHQVLTKKPEAFHALCHSFLQALPTAGRSPLPVT
jgi:pimeloyl-ACP methyl ester carboxylesterase